MRTAQVNRLKWFLIQAFLWGVIGYIFFTNDRPITGITCSLPPLAYLLPDNFPRNIPPGRSKMITQMLIGLTVSAIVLSVLFMGW